MEISHILVQHEYEAQDLLRKLSEGQAFAELAKKFSRCSSAASGGSLGDISSKMHLLDEAFREVCAVIPVGEIRGPIRTRFGFHLIRRVR
jgi:parvulin-like peptidyl-prolyl isomerase